MMETSTRMSFLIFALTILTVQGLSLNEARIKNAASSKSARAVPINQVVNARVNTLDEAADDGDDSGLFYSSSDVLPEDRDADQNLLDTLLMDIIQGTNGSTEGDLSKCQQYKPQIGEICMAKFVQRTRYRPDSEQQPDLPQQDKSSTGPLPSLSSRSPKRISSTLASPQQICCELKITYMRCLLTNLNFVCPLTEFNSEYEKVQGKKR